MKKQKQHRSGILNIPMECLKLNIKISLEFGIGSSVCKFEMYVF